MRERKNWRGRNGDLESVPTLSFLRASQARAFRFFLWVYGYGSGIWRFGFAGSVMGVKKGFLLLGRASVEYV
jgi:hypothetical protein